MTLSVQQLPEEAEGRPPDGGLRVETRLACNVLNQMTELGRPESFAINR